MYLNLRTGLLAILLSGTLITACRERPSKNATMVNGKPIPELLPADTVLGKPEERLSIRSTYNAALDALRKNGDDPAPYLKLAEAYLMQSRISGNSAYYQAAVLQVLDRLIEANSSTEDQRFMANMYKSNVLFGMNRFREAAAAAEEGLKLGDGNASIWGAAADANVELGRYEEARKATDRMMELRPDLRSYARVSYIRELRGNIPGAIEAMAMAMESGVPGLEPTEWARVQLGDLCLNAGKTDSAGILYRAALEFRPGYAPAHAGLARVATLTRNYPLAVRYLDSATRELDDPLYFAQLAQVSELAGDGTKAAAAIRKALDLMKQEEGDIPDNMAPKPNYAREYALIYRAARNYPKALEYARQDQQLRPENIQANQLLAWLLHLNGDSRAAVPLIEKSLSSGWMNPELLMQASVIHRAAGNTARADEELARLRKITQLTDPVLEAEQRK